VGAERNGDLFELEFGHRIEPVAVESPSREDKSEINGGALRPAQCSGIRQSGAGRPTRPRADGSERHGFPVHQEFA